MRNPGYPFGESWTGALIPSLGAHQTFALLPDYDPETDQYNTLARHYTPTGRWLSPDPGGLKVVRLDDPQTWNMYAYARNNPTTLSDPSGLEAPVEPEGGGDPTAHYWLNLQDRVQCGNQYCPPGAQNQSPAQMSSLQFLGQEVKGVWDATGGALLGLGASLLSGEGEKNIATTAVWAVTSPGKIGEAVKEAGHEAVDTAKAALSGDPKAIGQVVGTAATVAYAAKNLRVDSYKSGGGGINLLDTPTTGSRIGLDYNAWKGSNGPQLHLDITIKKPAAPFGPGASGPGSNLINIKHWTP